jgi:hypothetical protein
MEFARDLDAFSGGGTHTSQNARRVGHPAENNGMVSRLCSFWIAHIPTFFVLAPQKIYAIVPCEH